MSSECEHSAVEPMWNDIEHLPTFWPGPNGEGVEQDVSLTFGRCTTCQQLMVSVVLWDLDDVDSDHPGLPRVTGWRPLEPVGYETVPTRLTTERLHLGGH